MDDKQIKLLFALLRSAVCGISLSQEEISFYSSEKLNKLVSLARKHDVVHLLLLGLKKNHLLDNWNNDLKNEMLSTVYRYEKMNYEFGRICNALEQAGIPFMPLKGAVIRNYYPEPWMRTSCDIDVLVQEKELDRAVSRFENCLGYTRLSQNGHDVSLFSQNKTHIELHYDLMGNSKIKNADRVLQNIWEKALKHHGCNNRYDMPDDLFYFYHIAHMAKHFMNGGCGIRPFLDIWVLNHRVDCNKGNRKNLLVQGDLFAFSKQVKLLSEVWFSTSEHTKVTKQMEKYVLHGGTYGAEDNRIKVQQQQKGGRLNYALSKIFIPYSTIKFHYPILQKYRFLTPVMEVRRWGKLIFCGHLKRTTKELKFNNNVSKKTAFETQELLKNIGL